MALVRPRKPIINCKQIIQSGPIALRCFQLTQLLSHHLPEYTLLLPQKLLGVETSELRLILRTFRYLLSCCRLKKCFGAEGNTISLTITSTFGQL